MNTIRIDGKALAVRVRERVREDVARRVAAGAPQPGLATILVGDDPASGVYVASKRRAVREAGMVDQHRSLPCGSTHDRGGHRRARGGPKRLRDPSPAAAARRARQRRVQACRREGCGARRPTRQRSCGGRHQSP
ncbi:tetrahydrofolate dehydrogenase/cyclohydrolase catalytic domain-containing protein [Amycolatopsis pithecellobii]|uniref:tetrahydrofolate dehydrogenase/cyclohydrolase catalytic domain-containing protein n=1 Tax=Amycolatopsis pithecellobii TaxID=664692 RepID=UPI001AA09D79